MEKIKRKSLNDDEKRMTVYAIEFLMEHEKFLNHKDIEVLSQAREILQ